LEAWRGEKTVVWKAVNLVFEKAGLMDEKKAEKKVFVTVVCLVVQKVALSAAKLVV